MEETTCYSHHDHVHSLEMINKQVRSDVPISVAYIQKGSPCTHSLYPCNCRPTCIGDYSWALLDTALLVVGLLLWPATGIQRWLARQSIPFSNDHHSLSV